MFQALSKILLSENLELRPLKSSLIFWLKVSVSHTTYSSQLIILVTNLFTSLFHHDVVCCLTALSKIEVFRSLFIEYFPDTKTDYSDQVSMIGVVYLAP